MRAFVVEHCPAADEEHRKSKRQYAHVFHRPQVICVARAFEGLPNRLQIAILLHEAGHLLAGPRGGEDAANQAAKRYSGVTISYRDSRYGDSLEWIRPEDVSRAKAALGL